MEFRDRLVLARKQKGYNQEELAERIGVSRQAVSKWETGDAQPALSQLIALADALDISLDVLCGRVDSAPAATASAVPDGSGSPAPTNHRALRRQLILRLLIGILIGSLLSFGISGLIGPDVAQSEEAAAKNQLPDRIEVTGLQFFGSTYRDNVVDFEFVPSYINPDLTYTLNFYGFDQQTHGIVVESDNGIFHGSIELPSGGYAYTVTLEIRDDRPGSTGESRAVALATGLCFDKSNASWNPVTSIVEP